MFLKLFLMAIFFLIPSFAYAGAKGLEKQFIEEVKSKKQKKILSIAIENDSLGSGNDQNYTSGVRLSFLDLNTKFPGVAEEVAALIPTFDINETSYAFYSIGQNLYTPENISAVSLIGNDRPYAGFLYGALGMVTYNHNYVDEVEATLGIIGAPSLGEQAQRQVHKLVGATRPRGWRNQLRTEPGLMLAWQRIWPEYNSFGTDDYTLSLDPHIGASIGNIYTFANTGVTFRLNEKTEHIQPPPLRVRPSMPGAGIFGYPEEDWTWSAFAGIDGRALAQNIFLDGNSFRDSHSVDKRHFVADINTGISFTYKDTRISYTLVHRTKEFDSQTGSQVFGAISISQKF